MDSGLAFGPVEGCRLPASTSWGRSTAIALPRVSIATNVEPQSFNTGFP